MKAQQQLAASASSGQWNWNTKWITGTTFAFVRSNAATRSRSYMDAGDAKQIGTAKEAYAPAFATVYFDAG